LLFKDYAKIVEHKKLELFLKVSVRTIAKWCFGGCFATTPSELFGGFYFFNYRSEIRAFMRTITIRLFAAFATGAPCIGAGFAFDNIRTFLRNDRFFHGQKNRFN
jgi:hypothetical protein